MRRSVTAAALTQPLRLRGAAARPTKRRYAVDTPRAVLVPPPRSSVRWTSDGWKRRTVEPRAAHTPRRVCSQSQPSSLPRIAASQSASLLLRQRLIEAAKERKAPSQGRVSCRPPPQPRHSGAPETPPACCTAASRGAAAQRRRIRRSRRRRRRRSCASIAQSLILPCLSNPED